MLEIIINSLSHHLEFVPPKKLDVTSTKVPFPEKIDLISFVANERICSSL